MCEIFIVEKKYINSEETSVVVLFELPAHDWSELSQSPQWKAVENFLSQLNENGGEKKMPKIEKFESLHIDINKGIYEVNGRDVSKSGKNMNLTFEDGEWTLEISEDSFFASNDEAIKAKKESRQALWLSVAALILSSIAFIIRIIRVLMI